MLPLVLVLGVEGVRDAISHEFESVEVDALFVLEIISFKSAISQLKGNLFIIISIEDELIVLCEVKLATLSRSFLGCHSPEYALVSSVDNHLPQCSLLRCGRLFEQKAVSVADVKNFGV